LSTIKYYRDEYLVHIRDKKCPAGVCKNLIAYRVIPETCTGCMACVNACVYLAITGRKKEPQFINPDICRKCGACAAVCKYNAIEVS
jgi:TPP-dependent indolepyruvate ferredoxin oxidoreductase alpha subunit